MVFTRIIVGTIAYLVMMQLLSPAIDECPNGNCLLGAAYWTLGRVGQLFPSGPRCDQLPVARPGGCTAYGKGCEDYTYRRCN